MSKLPLGLIALLVLVLIISWAMDVSSLLVFSGLMGALAIYGFWESAKKREAEKRDLSDQAGSIALAYALRTDATLDQQLLYVEQGKEMYRYHRRKGASNEAALEQVRREYSRAYDRAERKAIREMTRPQKRQLK